MCGSREACSEKAHVICAVLFMDYDIEVGAGYVLLADDKLSIVFLAAEDVGDAGFE